MTETADINVRSLLEAARRAEADGNVDAAIRAWHHITENYARSPEARLAAEALARRHAGHSVPGQAMAGSPMPPPPPGRAPSPQPQAMRPQQAGMSMPLPAAGPPPPRQPSPHLGPHNAPRPLSHSAPQLSSHHATPHQQPHHAAPQPHRTHVEPDGRHYRFGRAIAYLTGFIGGAILIAAIVAAALNLGATFGYVSSPVFANMLIGWPLILLTNALGLFLVLLSQMARATFDAADAAARGAHRPH